MGQRDILENSAERLNMLRGPAKILYAPFTLAMPVRVEQVIDPTGGAPATGWSAFGLTRGGINVTKRIDRQVLDDVDQIIGQYGQQTTNKAWTISTQLAEVLDRAQRSYVMETGLATVVSTTGATQIMTPLDSSTYDALPRRIAVVYPKKDAGKVYAFVFRNVEPSGGDRTWRFDRSDAVSPALDLVSFPELATAIPVEQRWGVEFEHI